MNQVKHFERNTRGRDFAVGDIHACVTKLKTALRTIGFDVERDRLFAVGDLVDRGHENDEAIQLLDEPWFHSVLGNHEQMAIRFAHGDLPAPFYVSCGGGWNIANPQSRRIEIADTFSALPVAMEVETAHGLIGIVHADYPLGRWQDIHERLAGANRESLERTMLWSRDRFDLENRDNVDGVRAVIVGHTPLVRYSSLGNTIYIDTGAWIARENRPFTILDLETLQPVRQPSVQLWDER
jgi:serine/threonine protein phosphatase 1